MIQVAEKIIPRLSSDVSHDDFPLCKMRFLQSRRDNTIEALGCQPGEFRLR